MLRPLIASLFFLAACNAEGPPTGQLGAAIVGTGGSGTTYRLPAGAFLSFNVGPYSDTASLDGDAPSVTVDVPVGDGSAHLLHPEGYQDIWPLERLLPGGGFEVVHGRLITPMPMSFTITEDAITSLVIAFEVAGGTITFAHGTLEVTVDVDEVGATGASFELTGEAQVFEQDYTQAELLGGLMPAPEDAIGIVMRGTLTGPWYPSIRNAICAPADLLIHGGGTAAYSAYLGEVEAPAGGQGRICVMNNGESATLVFNARRQGAPVTEVFADVADDLSFETTVWFSITPSPFDGTTLDLSAMNGTFSDQMLIFNQILHPTAGMLYNAGATGPATLEFVPFN